MKVLNTGDGYSRWRHSYFTTAETTLDQWHLAPGDQIPAFMERAIRENDFVLIVCTPRYKKRSDNRTGGAGYEGDIISAEVLAGKNHRKFIPILRKGKWEAAAPSSFIAKYYIDLRGDPYSMEAYRHLLDALLRDPAHPPAVRARIEPLR